MDMSVEVFGRSVPSLLIELSSWNFLLDSWLPSLCSLIWPCIEYQLELSLHPANQGRELLFFEIGEGLFSNLSAPTDAPFF